MGEAPAPDEHCQTVLSHVQLAWRRRGPEHQNADSGTDHPESARWAKGGVFRHLLLHGDGLYRESCSIALSTYKS